MPNRGRLGLLLTLVLVTTACPRAGPPAGSPPSAQTPTPTESSNVARTIEGTWRRMPPVPPPGFNGLGAGQWTGKELIVWNPAGTEPGHGFSYNPSTKKWRPLRGRIVGGYGDYVDAWTGKVLIIWGGDGGEETSPNEGASYDPHRNKWSAIARSPLSGGTTYVSVWTGKELFVWGTRGRPQESVAEAAAYDPVRDAWATVPVGPIAKRGAPSIAWTGREILLWGGARGGYQVGNSEAPLEYFVDGAAYDPARRSWRTIAKAPLEGRTWNTSVWTGREFIVWGGMQADRFFDDGAAYDPGTDTWRRIKQAPFALRAARGLNVGGKLLVWGGLRATPSDEISEAATADGAVYDPVLDEWRMLPPSPLAPRSGAITAWTGTELIVWGGCCLESHVDYRDGATFEIAL